MPRPRNWTPETESLLRAAGWYPGRQVKVELAKWASAATTPFRTRPRSQAAEQALAEFGGLRAQAEGAGMECARGGFHLDPELADVIEDEELARYRPLVSGELFPLGERDDGHASLFLDDAGRVYMLYEELELIGDTIEEALDAILVGRAPRKLR